MFFNWIQYTRMTYNGKLYPLWAETIGWLMAVLPVVLICSLTVHKWIRPGYSDTVATDRSFVHVSRSPAVLSVAHTNDNVVVLIVFCVAYVFHFLVVTLGCAYTCLCLLCIISFVFIVSLGLSHMYHLCLLCIISCVFVVSLGLSHTYLSVSLVYRLLYL